MKTIIGSALRCTLCSFLCGAAAFWVVPANSQTPADIVWVTSGFSTGKYYSIGKYSTDGKTAIPNFITEPTSITSVVLCPTRLFPNYAGYLGAILVSNHTLYVDTAEGVTSSCLDYLMHHPILVTYIIATYNAGTGNVIKFPFFGWPFYPFTKIVPRGMALSGPNLYVATAQGQVGSISKIATTAGGGGNISFATPAPAAPYALAVNGNVLYVTNNAQNSNGDFYISTYTADTGALIQIYFIVDIQRGGFYGLALKNIISANRRSCALPFNTLYVSVLSGSAPGVYTYDACTGQRINPSTGKPINGPFVSVNAPWGIAIGSPRISGGHPTLYVASHQDSAIYEFDAINGGQPFGSIKLSAVPMNITVEPAAAVGN